MGASTDHTAALGEARREVADAQEHLDATLKARERAIQRAAKDGWSTREIATVAGVSQQRVSQVLRGL